MFTITANFRTCLNGWCCIFIYMYYAEPLRADIKLSVITSVLLFVAMSVISIHLRTLSIAEDS